MSSEDKNPSENIQTFADVVQQLALGVPKYNIRTPQGLSIESFESGLRLTRDNRELTIATDSGLVRTSDGQTTMLRTTNSDGEMDAFKRHCQGAFVFGQRYADNNDQLAVSVTSRKTLVVFDDDLGSALLVSHFDDGTQGIAMFRNGRLSAAECNAPKIEQALDRDLSPLLPTTKM